MENGGQGTGGAGGSNGNQAGGVAGGVGGGQAAGAAATATTTADAQSQITTTSSGFQTSTTSSQSTSTTAAATSSSSAAPSSSSGIQNGAIIGGIVGGIAGLIIISLIALWLLRRKKNKNKAKKIGTTEPVTYAGLNASFSGVRFGGSAPSPSSTQGHHDSLLPPPLFTPGASTSNSGVNIRGGETSPYMRDSQAESAQFLHSYADSHSDTMSRTARSSLGRIDTSSHGAQSDTFVSPMSPGFAPLSPVAYQNHKPGLTRQDTTDTMGFPREHDEELDTLPPMPRIHAPNRDTMDTMNTLDSIDTMGFPLASPHTSVALAAPRPVHPVNQHSLEYQVRSEMSGVESPVLGFHERQPSKPQNVQRQSQLSKVDSYESPVATKLGVSRNMSQRTMASVSDYGPDVISDDELERLGVGLGRRLTPDR